MRFPLRFTAGFQLGVIARLMNARGRLLSVLQLAPYSAANANPLPPVQSMSRIVWIGGAEPLEYPEIPRFVNALAAGGREVFLYTDGALLRRRIHEFEPSGRFRFVLRFAGPTLADDGVALEAVRGARLAGFLICALLVLRTPGEIDALEKVNSELRQLDLDGRLVVAGARTLEVRRLVMSARSRLLPRRWLRWSGVFDEVAVLRPEPAQASPEPRGPRQSLVRPVSHPGPAASRRDGGCEEGAQA
jgi:hypothetical protein